MSLSSTLAIATSGLTAASARAQTTASNISNANTDGYVRRVTVLAEQLLDGQGAGVRVLTTEQARAGFLVADRMRLDGDNAYAAQRSITAEQLTQIIGAPGDDLGLVQYYARFETALRDAAATPESAVRQQALLDAAKDLTNAFADMSSQADDMRSQADRDIGIAVGDVNAALKELERLNTLAGAALTPAVLDQRQRLVDQINQYIPVTARPDGDRLQLTTEGGVTLLGIQARTIEFSTAGNVGRTQTLGAPLSGLVVDGIDITPGGTGPQQSRGGKLAALFETRDTLVPHFQDRLDGLATDLVTRFSDDAVDPTKTVGEAGLFVDGISTSPTGDGIGIAARLRINTAIDPSAGGEIYRLRDGIGAVTQGPSGNGDQLNRLLGAFTAAQSAPAGLDVSGQYGATFFVAEVTSLVGAQDSQFADSALFAGARMDTAREAELKVLGVDTDQEMQQLLIIEQAYSANARVIQTVTTLIDQLLSIA